MRLKTGRFFKNENWLGLKETFRAQYYKDIIDLNPQLELIKEIYKQDEGGLGLY